MNQVKPGLLKQTFETYKHGLILLYLPFYFLWFRWLERAVTNHFHVIHMPIDDKIPFIEYFVVPYLLWFVYVTAALVYFFFRSKSGFLRLCLFLFSGMTVFLIISTVYPNGHFLRPQEFVRDNIFTDLVRLVYAHDTPTNLFPSIHVYNSIGVHIAVCRCADLKDKPAIRFGSCILMAGIVLSTVFLKQHSVFDVIIGMVCAIFAYTLVYAGGGLRVGESRTALSDFRQI